MLESPAPSKSRFMLKTILARLFAVFFGLLFAWLLLEVLLRVGFDALPSSTQGVIQHVRRVPWNDAHLIPVTPFTGSREYHARIPPGLRDYKIHWGDAQFTFDSIDLWGGDEGFRTNQPEWPMHIVAVGDSFTFCWTAFEDCWVERLHSDFGWHVMNLGVPGTGVWAHRNVLEAYAPPMEPAVVVMQWFGNDFKDDYDFARIRGEVDELAGPPAAPSDPNYGKFAEYSAVYRLIRDWWYKRDHPQEGGLQPVIAGRKMFVSDSQFSHDLSYKSVAYGWEKTIRALDESHTIVEDQIGAKFVILLIPTKEETYARYLADTLDPAYLEMLTEGRKRLLDVCAEKGWRCLDMTETLQAAVDAGQTVYNAFDFHLDASGNKLVAETLGNYLIDNGLLARP